MARLPRISPPGIPQHVIQRGNNRQVCFTRNQDQAVYARWLTQYANQFDVQVHAWVFMTNHVHLLATPQSENGVSKMMQALGRRYVQYFNRAHSRSGTLWEGRFKASLVQSEHYLLTCQRYIELNPVRALMVKDPEDYCWSSYRCNALGKESQLHTPHPEYLSLGRCKQERQTAYRAMFHSHLGADLIEDIRSSVNKGLAFGSEGFKEDLEALYSRRLTPAKLGRPVIEGE